MSHLQTAGGVVGGIRAQAILQRALPANRSRRVVDRAAQDPRRARCSRKRIRKQLIGRFVTVELWLDRSSRGQIDFGLCVDVAQPRLHTVPIDER
jgi:hypothetical protein